jgi:hypothetical protein
MTTHRKTAVKEIQYRIVPPFVLELLSLKRIERQVVISFEKSWTDAGNAAVTYSE